MTRWWSIKHLTITYCLKTESQGCCNDSISCHNRQIYSSSILGSSNTTDDSSLSQTHWSVESVRRQHIWDEVLTQLLLIVYKCHFTCSDIIQPENKTFQIASTLNQHKPSNYLTLQKIFAQFKCQQQLANKFKIQMKIRESPNT